MQYSPKLKIAMDEIKSILKKHDIAGSIIIHTPGFSEYLHHINPSYSCAHFEGDFLRIKASLKDFKGDKEAHKKKLEDTINMISTFALVGGQVAMNFIDIENKIRSKADFDTTGGGHSGHTQQNN